MRGHLKAGWAVLLGATALYGAGCGYVGDRLQGCRHVNVDLVNRPPVGPPVHLVVEEEFFTDANIVAGGASRRVSICLEKNDQVRFKAADLNDNILAIVNCVSQLDVYQFQERPGRIVWEPAGFTCERF